MRAHHRTLMLLFQKRMSLNDGHNHPDEDRDATLPLIKFLPKNTLSQPEVIEDVSIVVPGPSAKRPERKRQSQVSVSNVYYLYITEVQILSTQKSELPSPPHVRPCITITRPHTVQNPE